MRSCPDTDIDPILQRYQVTDNTTQRNATPDNTIEINLILSLLRNVPCFACFNTDQNLLRFSDQDHSP